MGIVKRPDNEANSAYNKVLVKITTHAYGNAIAGVGEQDVHHRHALARVVVGGLDTDTRHWYRFVLDGHVTPVARTRTAPGRSGSLPRTTRKRAPARSAMRAST